MFMVLHFEAPVFVPRGVSTGSKTGTEQTSAISSAGSGSVPAKEASSVDIPAPVDGPPGDVFKFQRNGFQRVPDTQVFCVFVVLSSCVCGR